MDDITGPFPGLPPVTWEQIVTYARSLEAAALRDAVPPEQGARLVRLVLEFNQQVIGRGGPVNTKPNRPPPATSAE